jgi:integrase
LYPSARGATASLVALRARVDVDEKLPLPLTRDQFLRLLGAAQTTQHRLLLRCLWETGGRVTEVLAVRPCDVDKAEGAIRMLNRKQRRPEARQKLVYVSRDLVAELLAHAHGTRLHPLDFFFSSRQSGRWPMHRGQAWRIVTAASSAAGVLVGGKPAGPLNFRHGAAVHQLRSGVPLSEVKAQLGHAAYQSTLVYLRLTNPQRREYADRMEGVPPNV